MHFYSFWVKFQHLNIKKKFLGSSYTSDQTLSSAKVSFEKTIFIRAREISVIIVSIVKPSRQGKMQISKDQFKGKGTENNLSHDSSKPELYQTTFGNARTLYSYSSSSSSHIYK